MGRPPLISQREPPSTGPSHVQMAGPEACAWHLQTVLGRPFTVSIFETRELRLMGEGTCPCSMAGSDSKPYPLTLVPPPWPGDPTR